MAGHSAIDQMLMDRLAMLHRKQREKPAGRRRALAPDLNY